MNDTLIEKKAYFGRRDLKKVTIPESVRTVGDWAFASCRNLEEVEFAGEDVILGKAVFQKCERLRKICVKGKHPDAALYLDAAKYDKAVFDLDAHVKEIGEGYPELRAFFLRDSNEEKNGADFFDALKLDF